MHFFRMKIDNLLALLSNNYYIILFSFAGKRAKHLI